MRKPIIAAAIALTCGLQAAAAQTPESPGVSPRDAVALRRNGMLMSANIVGGMKDLVGANGDVSAQRFAARTLVRWAHLMPTLFIPGSGSDALPEDTRARPEIWTDMDGFRAKAADFEAAAQRLAELAAQNDRAGFDAQMPVLRQTCETCHAVYRGPSPGAG